MEKIDEEGTPIMTNIGIQKKQPKGKQNLLQTIHTIGFKNVGYQALLKMNMNRRLKLEN